MDAIIDVNLRAVCPAEEFELVDSSEFATRIHSEMGRITERPGLRGLLTPPTYYSLATGIDDNRAINDALIEAARTRPGWRACGVAEPKYGDAAAAEIERLAGLGAAGIVWSPRAQGIFANDRAQAELCIHAGQCGLVSTIRSAPYSINEGLWRIWALAALCPGIPLVVQDAFESWENIQFVREHRGGGENVFYDLSLLSESWDLDMLAGSVGAERLLFGSGGGDLLERTLGIVERSSVPSGAKEAILSRNAAALFRLDGAAA